MAKLYTVIMAGGSGTRLWPASRKRTPKQVMPVLGGLSLFRRTVERLAPLAPPERTFVITSADQADMLRAQAPELPRENIVGEPVGRDSAPAVFLAAAIVAARDPSAVMLVAPADHLISPIERFHECVKRAIEVAEAGKFLVTFGIPPTAPATAYGYVERGRAIPGPEGAFRVKRFHEKPDYQTARRYVNDRRYYWNSGMFVWHASTILDAAKSFTPDIHDAIAPLGALFGTGEFDRALAAAYAPLRKISIDYAVMEKAPNIALVEADFDWTDVGSPVALRFYSTADKAGNIRQGLTELLESQNCITVSDDDHLLAVFGCDNLVVIHAGDATLVCPAQRAEDLKQLIAAIERREELRKFL